MENLRYLLQFRTSRRFVRSTLVLLFVVFLLGIGCDSGKNTSGGSGFGGTYLSSGGAGVGTIDAAGGSGAITGSGGSAGSILVSGSGGGAGSAVISGSGGTSVIRDSGVRDGSDVNVIVAGSGGMAGAVTGGTGGGDAATAGTGGSDAATAGTGGTTATDCPKFSFFVTSLEAMQRESGSQNGFGGDLGGLAGADDLCGRIAEFVIECAGNKQWRAFLSTSTEDAVERVGQGPWYDALGRTVALSVADLLNTRPANADPVIARDLPNEYGMPNHAPDGVTVDNHDTLTGSNAEGKYVGSASGTCNDWTSSETSGKPQIGHSWPGGPSEHWISAHTAPGCAPGVNLSDRGGPGSGSCVGCSGGYGGIYCFALQP